MSPSAQSFKQLCFSQTLTSAFCQYSCSSMHSQCSVHLCDAYKLAWWFLSLQWSELEAQKLYPHHRCTSQSSCALVCMFYWPSLASPRKTLPQNYPQHEKYSLTHTVLKVCALYFLRDNKAFLSLLSICQPRCLSVQHSLICMSVFHVIKPNLRMTAGEYHECLVILNSTVKIWESRGRK